MVCCVVGLLGSYFALFKLASTAMAMHTRVSRPLCECGVCLDADQSQSKEDRHQGRAGTGRTGGLPGCQPRPDGSRVSFSVEESWMIRTGIAGACVCGSPSSLVGRGGEAGPSWGLLWWLFGVTVVGKGYYVPKCVNFAVADTTHRLSGNDLGNSGLKTLSRGLCNLTQLTTLT